MARQETLGPSRHKRRRIARWLLAIGGSLLLIGIIAFIAGAFSASSPNSTEGGQGSSPWNAANVFGACAAITGLISAVTGLLALRSAKNQAPTTVYVMAAQPPAAPAGVTPVPAPQAVAADPAATDKTGKDDQAP